MRRSPFVRMIYRYASDGMGYGLQCKAVRNRRKREKIDTQLGRRPALLLKTPPLLYAVSFFSSSSKLLGVAGTKSEPDALMVGRASR